MLRFKVATIVSLFISFLAFGQDHTVCLGDDIEVCKGASVQIQDCGNGLGGAGVVLTNPSSVSLTDDRFSGIINIGFTFNFYGQDYTQCVIGSNGMISFNTSNANQSNSWSLDGSPLPNSGGTGSLANARNAAMITYHDINPGQGGEILYETIGTAPNRMFVVIYSNIPMFSSGECAYQAGIFYEGTNEIEFFISHKPISGWNGGLAIQGLQNSAGTVAHIVAGRNNTQWTTTNDGKLFTPDSPTNTTNYTISDIPFKTVFGAGAGMQWKSTIGQSFAYNGGQLNINSVQTGTRGYFLTLSGSSCNSMVGAISDTTWITGKVVTATGSSESDFCGAGVGSVTVTPTQGEAPYSYEWPASLGGATTQTVDNVPAGTYLAKVTDDMGCIGAVNITVDDVPADYDVVTTLVSCPGGNDGTATVTMVPELGNITYQWNDPAGQTTATAVGLSAGTYECTVTSDVGCNEVVEVTIEEIPGMNLEVLLESDVTCHAGNDGEIRVNITDGSAPYSYQWSRSGSVNFFADDLEVGDHTLAVTDNNGCVITQDFTLNEPAPLELVTVSLDTIICIGDSVMLSATGQGGSSQHTYTWRVNGQTVAVGDQVYVTPTSEFTEYCVTLSEACGSPVDEKCMVVNYPDEVNIMLSPDKTGDCFPVEVNFDNITETNETVDYTIWMYSDGGKDTTSGLSPVSHEFGEGIWDVKMTVVTDRGCVYEKDFSHLIEGYSYPVPDFYINPNPASVYEPNVKVYSQSSSDIVSYQWFADGASPSYSSQQNPTFSYPNEINSYPLILVVENEFGCRDTLEKIVRIENEVILYAPNTFTPDSDGFNDAWSIHISGIDKYSFELELFNRWGELIFESRDPEGAWDGTYGGVKVPSGTYLWKIVAHDYDNDNKYEFNGFVNVLR